VARPPFRYVAPLLAEYLELLGQLAILAHGLEAHHNDVRAAHVALDGRAAARRAPPEEERVEEGGDAAAADAPREPTAPSDDGAASSDGEGDVWPTNEYKVTTGRCSFEHASVSIGVHLLCEAAYQTYQRMSSIRARTRATLASHSLAAPLSATAATTPCDARRRSTTR